MFSRRKYSFLLFLPISICAVVSPLSAQVQLSPEQRDFKAKIVAAYTQRDDAAIALLVKENRFLVKPVVDELLTGGITSEFQKKEEEAQQNLAIAAKLAETHKTLFGERSLVLAVQYVAGWTKDQKIKKLRADSLNALAVSFRTKKETCERATQAYQQALAIYKEIGDRRSESVVLGGLGVVAFTLGNGTGLIDYAKQALAIRQEVDDRQLIGNSFHDIGVAYYSFLRDNSNAVFYYQKAESARTAIGDNVALSRSLLAKAQAYEKMGQLTLAIMYFQKAAQLSSKLGNKGSVATSLYDCARLYTRIGRYREALQILEEVRSVTTGLPDKKLAANILNQRGILYRELGELTLALADYQAEVPLRQQAKDESGEAAALNNIGTLLHGLRKLDAANQYFQRALTLGEKNQDSQLILEVESNLGMLQFDLGHYDKAEEYLGKALDVSRSLQDKEVEINNLINLANLQNYAGRDSLAFVNYNLAFGGAEALNNPALTWPPLLGLGDFYERRGDPRQALAYYDRALGVLEGIRLSLTSADLKASYWAQQRKYYEAIIHYLSLLHTRDKSKGYDLRAFDLAERAKSRAFLDLLAGAISGIQTPADSLLIAKQGAVFADLTQAQRQLEIEKTKPRLDSKAVQELNSLVSARMLEYEKAQQEIDSNFPRYAELHNPRPITLSEVQSTLLGDKTLLLEYSVSDSSTTLWAITKNTRSLFVLPSRDTLNQYIEMLRFAMTNPQSSDASLFVTAGHTLYRMLLSPLESYLKKNSKLIVIPDGVLHYVPFAALLAQKPTAKNSSFSTLPYLARTHQISYAASASVLKTIALRKTPAQTKQLVAFGDPVFASTSQTDLPRLPFTKEEVTSVASLFPAGATDVFLGSQATKEKAVETGFLGGYRLVHFATHGIINERKPDLSGILLGKSESSKDDGLLVAAEIFNLTLNADLVVLSACQTGLGKLVQGEGLIGLTRPFLYAGSRSVMVSLWSVADQSTSQLMQQFYKSLVSRKLEKAQALQGAQLMLMKDSRYSHPFYWAPFVLIGDRR